MLPYITLFGRSFTSYMLMSLIGAFAAGILMCRMTRKRGLDDNDTIVLLLISAIGVLFGGHLLYGITNIKYISAIFTAKTLKAFLNNAVFVFGGSVFYGGLFGGLVFGTAYLRFKRADIIVFSDMAAVGIPLFHFFARIGCFLSGCCYGIKCKFGFTAHNNPLVAEVNGVSRFPVQLLESLCNAVLFVLIYVLYKKSLQKEKLQGKLMYIYLISYSVIRFFDELLRGDEIRGSLFGLSTSQIISLAVFAVSFTATVSVKFKRPKIKGENI